MFHNTLFDNLAVRTSRIGLPSSRHGRIEHARKQLVRGRHV